ncbi:MAG: metallophosphoesterase [Pseudomonadota bacterium]
MTQSQSNLIKKLVINLIALLYLIHFSASAASARSTGRRDPVVMSFATVGDSRGDPDSAIHKQDQLWLQNTKALTRIMREIQAKKPQALFFNGDMIMGYSTDKPTLNRQYAYWRGLAANLMETGTYVFPVPGNHEVQEKSIDAKGKVKKIANSSSEESWRENMGDLIVDAARWKDITGTELTAFDLENAPAIAGADHIQTTQAQLSYSFDVAGNHFVVINTDPVGNDGHAPTHWLAEDLQKASERGAKNYFVFGHKPAFTYAYKADIGTDGIDKYPENKDAFWRSIEQYKATYFCGHQHVFNAMQPTLATGGKAWQIMVGTGGSPFSVAKADASNPQDRMYAWAIVSLHKSGKIHLEAFGFDEHYGKTSRLKSIYLK